MSSRKTYTCDRRGRDFEGGHGWLGLRLADHFVRYDHVGEAGGTSLHDAQYHADLCPTCFDALMDFMRGGAS